MKYFGTDGIRGKAYTFITEDLAYKVGRSMELLEDNLVIIARDTRKSGVMIANAIKKGVIDAGLKVLDLDIVATPILAYYSILKDCHGIMITASHNPYEDNGIKIFNRGIKTKNDLEQKIEDVIDGNLVLDNKNSGEELEYENPLANYQNLFNDFLVKSDLKIALDLAIGATCKSAKYIFSQISNNLAFIGDQTVGFYFY